MMGSGDTLWRLGSKPSSAALNSWYLRASSILACEHARARHASQGNRLLNFAESTSHQ